MSNKFEDFLAEQLKDPKVKKEYDDTRIFEWNNYFARSCING